MGEWKKQIVMACYVLTGMAAILFSFVGTFQIEYRAQKICLILVLFCIALTVVFAWGKKHGKWVIPAVPFGICGVSVLLFGERLKSSMDYILSLISAQADMYFKGSTLTEISADVENGDCGLIVILCILCSLFAYGVVCMKRLWLVVLMLMAGMLMPFSFGKIPSNGTLALLAVTMLGIVSYKSEHSSRVHTGLIAVSVGVAAVFAGTIFPGPQFAGMFEKQTVLKHDLEQFVERHVVTLFQGRGGVNDKTVGGVGSFGSDTSEHLKVETDVKPSERMYLKGYVGTEYLENQWKKPDEESFEAWAKEHHTSAEEMMNVNRFTLMQELKEAGQDVEFYLSIQNTGANKKYLYMPYDGIYGKDDRFYADTFVKAEGKKNYEIACLPHFLLEREEATEEERLYEAYVNQEYRDVPKHVEEAFRLVADTEITGTGMEEILEETAALLRNAAVYSLHPGKTPKGKDVAEYFYFENKKGYCEHFATTAVLLLRMKGIPARYVSGYSLQPEDFKQNAKGAYEAVVTGDKAHAWAEIFVRGSGWMPVEMTPSAASVALEEQMNTTQPEKPKNEQPETEELTKQETPKDEQVEMEEKETAVHVQNFRIIGVAVGVLIILSLIASLVIQRRQMNVRMSVLRRIGRLMVLAKAMKRGEEIGEDFARKLFEAFQSVDSEQAEQILEFIYKEKFANESLKQEEYQFCEQIYQKMQNELFNKASFLKRLWWKKFIVEK